MKKILSTFLLLSFTACGGSSLLNSNPSADGTGTLSMRVTHHMSDNTTHETVAGVKTFTNDTGYQVALSEAQLGWSRLILISGGSSEFPECVAGRDVTLNLAGADDLLAADLTNLSVLTNQEIQQISYCRYQIVFGPTPTPAALMMSNVKAHTTGVEVPSGSATPTTVTYHFQGRWSKGGDSGDFSFERTEPITLLARDFMVDEAGAPVSHPLHFHTGATHEDLGFETHYDTLFSGIDFMSQNPETQQTNLNSNFSESIHQSIVSD